MSIEIRVPAFPESVQDGVIVRWNHRPGDRVRRDENLVDIETDKVVFEVPAPEDGVLEAIEAGEGETVVSGQVIGRLQLAEAGEVHTAPAAPEPAAASSAAHEAAAVPVVTPAARRLIEEHGLDPSRIVGSGRGGRVLKEDVLRHLASRDQEGAPPGDEGGAVTPATASAAEAAAPPVTPESAPEAEAPAAPAREAFVRGREERRVPMTRLRARIAERLVEAQQTAAMLTTFNEIDMSAVIALRRRYREAFERRHGVKLGFLPFFVKAVIEGLRRFPAVNASIDGQDIVYHGFYDIGIAVSTDRGLVVPVLRDADTLGLAEIERQIQAYATKAREGSLAIEDITGGTFTITNGGVFGSLLSTPILNPPQTGILGMHKIEERPVVRDGEIVVRPMMYVALTYDHRLIDGREAVQFLVTVKEMIEDPARLLLNV
ncbi:MAG: 2-oxoglutarate dehydrogenase complex dihydrolipoyllysine-residue succinyltransferase [Gammaproteobacteria bacterium]|nr:MAG: 2-oxoglutarate dehydrogenase complex dihydrolipoyllysine-residue succinyltransferase [Gammaproteobacteria bacterium]